MEQVNLVLAENIFNRRKNKGLTQEGLAERLGVTFQAVSKWETAKASPDISLLPELAEAFGCSIDQLFSRNAKNEAFPDSSFSFPWEDDGVIRVVVFEGKNILQATDQLERVTFELVGDSKSVECGCNLAVHGSVSGGCSAGGDAVIDGNLSGGCHASHDITVSGNFSGGCNAGHDLVVDGAFSGGGNAREITCGGNLSGDVNATNVTVNGNVKAKMIEGNIVCNAVKCDHIDGEVTIVQKN